MLSYEYFKKMCGFNSYLYEREPQVVLVSFVRDRIHDLLFILLLELVYQTGYNFFQFLSSSLTAVPRY